MTADTKETDTADHNTETESSGKASYHGFEYQTLATVWLGLELFTTGIADEIDVEPPVSQEDVEVALVKSEEELAELADSGVRLNKVEIQIKYRSAPAWKSRDFNVLLAAKPKKGKKGPAPRISPIDFLVARPSFQYILLTNAQIDPSLKSFEIEEIGKPSSASKLPCAQKKRIELARRIGIMPGNTEKLLTLSIQSILLRNCHVPGDQFKACLCALMKDVRSLLTDSTVSGSLTKKDMFTRIREFGGKFEQPREPVQPKNHANFTDHLTKKHALIIIGPPGTGKTTLAESLVSKLEMHDPPFKRCVVNAASDISEVRRLLKEPDNHVFYFEDPWGRYETNTDASTFTSELPKLLTKAQPGKVFIVTSPQGVFSDAVGNNTSDFDPFTEYLTGEDYDIVAYRKIYERSIEDQEPAIREKCQRWQEKALTHIMTPLAVGTFCIALLNKLSSEERIDVNTVKQMANNSNVEHTSRVIRDTFKNCQTPDIMSVIAIWAHLAVSQLKMTVQDARSLRHLIRTGGMSSPPEVECIFRRLVEAGWLKLSSSYYSAHSTVLEALAQFESLNPGIFEETIEALFRGWFSVGKLNTVLACVSASKGRLGIVPTGIKDIIDNKLIDIAKRAEGHLFFHALNDIAQYSTTQHPVAELARLLAKVEPSPPRNGWFIEMNHPKWMKPSLAASEIDKLKVDSEWFVKTFVTEYLLHDSSSYFHNTRYDANELIGFLNQFGWPIREWFNTAFENSLRWSEVSAGFLTDCICVIDALSLDRIFDVCLKTYQEVCDRPHTYDHEEYRKEEQGEIDASRCEDYDDSESCIAKSALRSALFHKNKRDGYTWISSHPAVMYLLKPWSDLLNGKEDPNELSDFITCCVQNGAIGVIYDVLRYGADTTLVPIVVNLILKQTELSHAAISVAETYANLPEFLTTIERESKKVPFEQRTLVGLRLMSGSCSVDTVLERLLPDDELRIVKACYSAKIKQSIETISDQNAEGKLIQLLISWPENAAIFALAVLQHMGTDISQWIERFTTSKDSETRTRTWRICADKTRLLSHGLVDEDCWCRVASLENLAERATHEEQLHLMTLATDKSANVRKALAECIGNKQWADGVSPLISLLRDCREFGSQEHENDFRKFKVARSACDALNKYTQLPETAVDSIRSFLGECTKASVDTTVHGLLFRILSKYPSEDSMSFCSRYIAETWLESKWRKNYGHSLLVQCLHSIIEMLLSAPELAVHLDVTNIETFARLDDDENDLVGPSLTIFGLTSERNERIVHKLEELETFTPDRALLLLAASEFLQKHRPGKLTQHLDATDPFKTLLEWTSTKNRQPPYGEFCIANPPVAAWVDSTLKDKKAGIPAYERWAISRLIGTPATTGTSPCYNLPHPFSFAKS